MTTSLFVSFFVRFSDGANAVAENSSEIIEEREKDNFYCGEGSMSSKLLSKIYAIKILYLINATLSCNSEEILRKLFLEVQDLIAFEFCICGHGTIKNDSVSSCNIINVNYPSKWLELYIARGYERIDPIVKEHIVSFKLQYWLDTYKKDAFSKEFVKSAEDFGLRSGYTTGLRSPEKNGGSMFTISGKCMNRSSRTALILDLLVPHFHQVLSRISSQDKATCAPHLSDREKEVLQWLTFGKTSWDISAILNISERTVNYHFGNIMQKLNAVNRSQALAIALDKKLIHLE